MRVRMSRRNFPEAYRRASGGRPFSMPESLRRSANRIAAVADPSEDRCESSSAKLGGRSKASHRERGARISGTFRCSAARVAAASHISRWEPSRFSGGSSFSRTAVVPQVSMKCVLACENRLSFRARHFVGVALPALASKVGFVPRPTRWWNRAVETTSQGGVVSYSRDSEIAAYTSPPQTSSPRWLHPHSFVLGETPLG